MSDLKFYKMNDKEQWFYEEVYARSLKYVEQQTDKWINGERQIEQ